MNLKTFRDINIQHTLSFNFLKILVSGRGEFVKKNYWSALLFSIFAETLQEEIILSNTVQVSPSFKNTGLLEEYFPKKYFYIFGRDMYSRKNKE